MANNPIHLSSSAASKINQLVLEEMNPDLKFRVYIIGGGCSGFQYTFDLTTKVTQEDLILENSGGQVAIDPISCMYMQDSEIDFVDDLIGQSFQIKNPNAIASCGCGTSFAL